MVIMSTASSWIYFRIFIFSSNDQYQQMLLYKLKYYMRKSDSWRSSKWHEWGNVLPVSISFKYDWVPVSSLPSLNPRAKYRISFDSSRTRVRIFDSFGNRSTMTEIHFSMSLENKSITRNEAWNRKAIIVSLEPWMCHRNSRRTFLKSERTSRPIFLITFPLFASFLRRFASLTIYREERREREREYEHASLLFFTNNTLDLQ